MHNDNENDNQEQHVKQDETKKMGETMMVLCWVGALIFVTYAVFIWMEKKKHPNSRLKDGRVEVVLKESANHHHFSYGKINNQQVVFLVDTGASDVVIPEGLAKKLNLKKGEPRYASTANGIVEVYSTKIESLELGDIKLVDINASINPGMNGKQVLLGMSALKYLDFRREDGQLILRQ